MTEMKQRARAHAVHWQYDTGFAGKTNASTTIADMSITAVYGFSLCFLATGVVGVWAAYDGSAALGRFFLVLGGVICVMVAPYLGARLSPASTIGWISALSQVLVFGTATLYIAQQAGAAALNQALGLLPLQLNDNQTAQILVIGLPFVVFSLWLATENRRHIRGVVSGIVFTAGLVALLMTGSRGGWIGIICALILSIYLLMRRTLTTRSAKTTLWRWIMDVLAVIAISTILAAYVVVVLSPEIDTRLGVSAHGGSAFSRIALWRDSLPLIADYFFTGSGLASTAMIYSTYAFLLHVPYLYHAHNFYIQVALEQGVPALLAWIGLIFATAAYALGALQFADRSGYLLLVAGFASLTAFLAHSLFEAELYFGALAALVFFAPAALLWSAASVYAVTPDVYGSERSSIRVSATGFIIGLVLPVLVAISIPGAVARWEANIGAVMQARAELSIYNRPEWSMQDQVRRQAPAALEPSEAWFVSALEHDPGQPTAHRRLGQIALAQGEFDRAREHLITAHSVAPHDRATRQLLGEVYALEGDVDGAVQIWQGLDVSQGQFMVREWWYQALGQPEQMEKLSNAVQAFKRSE